MKTFLIFKYELNDIYLVLFLFLFFIFLCLWVVSTLFLLPNRLKTKEK